MITKRIFTVLLTALLTVSAAACGDDKSENENSVKVPKSIEIESSVTYDEAIEGFKYDENLSEILKWAKKIHDNLCLLCYHDVGGSFSSHDEQTGEVISNVIHDNDTGIDTPDEEAVTNCINRLAEEFNSEPEYTKYVTASSNGILIDAYTKFIGYAKDMQQKYAQTRPTFKDNSMSIDLNRTKLTEYYSPLDDYMFITENMEAKDYLTLSLSTVFDPLQNIEVYCICNEKWFAEQMKSEESSPIYQRMLENMVEDTEEMDIDYELSMLEAAMGQKNNLNAIAKEALKDDDTAIQVYNDFMEEANRLYEIVRLHRPEDASTDYAQKYNYNLDKLHELKIKLNQ